MLPASNSGVGMNLGFPDVCVTPVGPAAVPIPYPNMAMNATAAPFSPNILLSFVPALNMASTIPMTLGDQAGTLSPFMGPGRYTMGNPKILVNALPGINLLCPTTGNNMVNGLGSVLVPSITNVFFSQRGEALGADLDREALSRIGRAAPAAAAFAAERLEGDVVLIRVPVFTAGLPACVHTALERAPDASALVLDLRGCPGGELLSAIELAGDFLDEGAVIVREVDGDGDETVHVARRPRAHAIPIFLVVDGMTASAAEVFAGALQKHDRAVVVGERTYGKGTAQAVVAGPFDPGARYATMAALLLADGAPIEGRGVQPDVEAPSESSLEAALGAARSTARPCHEVR